jgi:hypothetical protein
MKEYKESKIALHTPPIRGTDMSFLPILLLLYSGMAASQIIIPRGSTSMPQEYQDWSLVLDNQAWSVRYQDQDIAIPAWQVDAPLRGITPNQLSEFVKVGYLKVKSTHPASFRLSGHVRGPGGLVGAAVMSAASVRAFFYGVPLLAVLGGTYSACNAAGVSIHQASESIDERLARQAAAAAAATAAANTPAVAGVVWVDNGRGLDSCEMVDTTFNGERLVMMPDGLLATAHYVNGVATSFSNPHDFGGPALNAPALAPTVLAPTVLAPEAPLTAAEAIAAKTALKAAQVVAATGTTVIGFYQANAVDGSLPGVAIAAVELAHDTVVGPTTADQVGTSMVLGGMLGFGKWYVASVEAMATAAYIAGMAFPYF